MGKFMAGLASGIVICLLTGWADYNSKLTWLVIGVLLGAGMIITALIFFLSQNHTLSKPDHETWWREGKKAPWEEEEYDPYKEEND